MAQLNFKSVLLLLFCGDGGVDVPASHISKWRMELASGVIFSPLSLSPKTRTATSSVSLKGFFAVVVGVSLGRPPQFPLSYLSTSCSLSLSLALLLVRSLARYTAPFGSRPSPPPLSPFCGEWLKKKVRKRRMKRPRSSSQLRRLFLLPLPLLLLLSCGGAAQFDGTTST